MIKKVLISLLAVIVFIVALGVFIQKTSFNSALNNQEIPITPSVTINDKVISVEVVKEPKDREKGLSGRESLGEYKGMLFVFDSSEKPPSFWMKDMLISLDIIWIRDGKIVRIDKAVPAPAPDTKLKLYSPGQSIDYVLEVNSGLSEANSIIVGDPVSISGI